MKKIFIYFLAFVSICFILPAIFTRRTAQTNTNTVTENNISNESVNEQNNVSEQENYEYKNYGKIQLLHNETGEVEEVEMDEYLYHVVSAEMPVDFEVEALKAQAIVARTYTVYKIKNRKHNNADICDSSSCCQAWISKEDRLARWDENLRENNWNKIVDCVNSTKGKIITYNNEPINAFFHSNSGGMTEVPVNVWGGTGYPYLQAVETSGEEGYEQYKSEVILSQDELLEKLKQKYPDISIDFGNSEDIKILSYTDGKRVKTVKFGNKELSGVETRTLLGLRSANFEISKEGETIKFTVLGYGHGVGMSQTGADSLAKQGKNYEEILKHFYSGVEITDINSL